MKSSRAGFFVFLAVIAIACLVAAGLVLRSRKLNAVEGRETVQYVRDVLADRDGRDYSAIKASALVPAYDIAIIGTDSICARISERLYLHDLRDNISGRHIPDGLPDFAGETFVNIAAEKTLDRTQSVMSVVRAVDTLAHVSPYDSEGSIRKKPAKIVVLADPMLAENVSFDVDTLFSSIGAGVMVVTPLELAIDKAFSGLDPDLIASIGLMYDSEVATEQLYLDVLSRKADEYGFPRADCCLLPVEGTDSLMHKMVNLYASHDHEKPMDVVIVDNLDVDLNALETEVASMVSVMNESSLTYRRLVSDRFRLVSTYETTTEYVYDELRKDNLFTHDIAKPRFVGYRPVTNPQGGEIILIPSSYVQE